MTREVIHAIDRLNSYVRSDACGWSGSLKRAVYAFKNACLKALLEAGTINFRAIVVHVKCRDCGGSGRYVDSWCHEHDHCRACRNTGMVDLGFVESTLPSGFVWHTPHLQWPGPSCFRSPSLDYNWKPNSRGWPLRPFQVAYYLAIVEEWYWTASEVSDIHRDVYYDHTTGYSIHLGRIKQCLVCGERRSGCGECHSAKRIQWTHAVCDACRPFHEPFSIKKLPHAILKHPAFRRWAISTLLARDRSQYGRRRVTEDLPF